MAVAARPVGRPRTRKDAPPRSYLGSQVPPEFKKRVEAAANASKRSLSAEVLSRLEQSFQHQDLLEPALELAYGRKFARLLLILARVMSATGQHAVFEKTRSFQDQPDSWIADPYAFDQVIWAVETILEGLRPAGDPAFHVPRGPHATAAIPEVLGQHAAAGLLASLARPDLRGGSDSAAALDARAFAVESLQKLGPGISVTVPPLARRREGQTRAAGKAAEANREGKARRSRKN